MRYTRVAALDELPPGTLRQVEADGETIALVNVQGEVRAWQGLCPHRNGPLGQGNLADGYIICPWHAWEFSASTGEFDFNPAIRLREFAVEIRGGAVWVAVG